jgi:hypothetical protein
MFQYSAQKRKAWSSARFAKGTKATEDHRSKSEPKQTIIFRANIPIQCRHPRYRVAEAFQRNEQVLCESFVCNMVQLESQVASANRCTSISQLGGTLSAGRLAAQAFFLWASTTVHPSLSLRVVKVRI